MDKRGTPTELIKAALEEQERTKAWLSRTTRIPLTTLDRRLRGEGLDFTLAQLHAIATALDISVLDLTSLDALESAKAAS